MYRLEEDDVTRLSNQPETGMGYQLIQAKVGGKDDLFLVFNCELLATLEELSDVKEYFTEDKLKAPRLQIRRSCAALKFATGAAVYRHPRLGGLHHHRQRS